MKEFKFIDNNYISSPSNKNKPRSCLIFKNEETELWHGKLEHLNLRSIRKIVVKKAIIGLPDFKIEEGKICGVCQVGN